jgi:hypothetical protein
MNRAQRRATWHPRIAVPRYEPEVVEAAARKFGGDHDKVATTSVDVLMVGGVEVSSRYNKAEELTKLAAIVLTGLSPRQRKFVKSVWYDSAYSDSYTITILHKNSTLAEQIGSAFEAGAIWLRGRHNSVSVEAPDGTNLANFNCHWEGEGVR